MNPSSAVTVLTLLQFWYGTIWKSVNTVTAELGFIVEIPLDRVRAKLPMPMSIHLPKMME